MNMNEVFETALEIALEAHKGQVDKNGVAYITHPIAVAAQLESLELKTIAILHDTIEDTDVTAEYLIKRGIPKNLVEVVELLTKPKDEEYESYLKRVRENPMAKAVKLADLAHNTSPERASGLNDKRRAKYELAKRILSEK
jgi:(p)ppGpp synthase/HD superfamily hydrolase